MKTTLDIPEHVLNQAMQASGARTKREAVLQALEDFNRRAKLRALARRLGRSTTFMNSEELTKLRSREVPSLKNS